MTERLQKILAARSVASRRKAEEMLREGRVTVNGKTASLGDSADAEADEIRVDGKIIPSPEKKVYMMLNKPRGYVTTLSDEKGRKTVAELVADCGIRVYPVGRLDMDSEGLLILTNDGELANSLMHPGKEVEKVYRVWVRGYESGKERALMKPVTLDGYTIRTPKVELQSREADRAQFLVTIHEGRNRQIRRMCALCGMEVLRLKRVREGKLALGNLECGSWRYLTPEEKAKLTD